jgi:hypothetical protein
MGVTNVRTIATPHRFITGSEGHEVLPHFELTISSSRCKKTWIFCNFDCLIAWFKEQYIPECVCKNREDVSE